MQSVQKLCISFVALLAVLLVAKPVSGQPLIQPPLPEGKSVGLEATSPGRTSTEALINRIKSTYSNQSSLRSKDLVSWQPGENLIAVVPAGWKVGFQNREGHFQTVEFLPEGQTVNAWKDLLTLQIAFGGLSKSPREMFEQLTATSRSVCPRLDVSPVMTGEENGYPFALWVQICPNNSEVNQAEITLFKLIQGKDSFYFVQRAWRVSPLAPNQAIPISPTEFEQWGAYMRQVGVCDTRIPERNCP